MTRVFQIKVAGRQFTGEYLSSGLAIMLAQCFYRVHSATAIRVSP